MKSNNKENIKSDEKSINKKQTKNVILTVIIIILFILKVFAILYKAGIIHKKYQNDSLYVPYSQRQSYVIRDVSDSLLSDYLNNKVTLVLCMATWCTNCKEDASAISEFMKQNPDVQVIIVAQDPEKSDVESYLKETNQNWFVIFDPKKTIRAYLDPGKTTIPNTYLLNEKGEVINKYEGKMSYDELVDFYNNEKD